MGDIFRPDPVLPLVAVFTRHPEAATWAKEKLEASWGKIALESEAFPFDQTSYYEPTMGAGLKKTFFAFESTMDPANLAEMKRQTNDWESLFATQFNVAECRPLNMDPGYLALGKLVLASTKDFYHRIYLEKGIYAEVTLKFSGGRWCDFPWTFPDYRSESYHQFFTRCREKLRTSIKNCRSDRLILMNGGSNSSSNGSSNGGIEADR